MKVSFNYDEKALIDYQLYVADKSAVVTKTRNRNRWLLSLIYIAIGLFGIFKGDQLFTVMFLVIGVLWYAFYPMWGGRFYKKQFTRFVKANYKNRLGKSVDLDFQDNQVQITEAGESATFGYEEFDSIIEIPTSFLIKLKTDVMMIIDKNATISKDEIAAFLKALASKLNINYLEDNHWKWK